ncbi:MAG: response regulator [Thermodesulfobacteriota bacterium]
MTPHTILFVDDEKSILKALTRLFLDENYRILTAQSGREALTLLASGEKPTVIISDQRMPEMGGAEFLAEAKKILPDSIRMVLTGYADITAAVDAINIGGVYRYILKPWNDEDLKLTIREAISRFELVEENRTLTWEIEQRNRELAELNAALEQRVEERTRELRKLVKELEGRNRIQQYLMQIHPLDDLLQAILAILAEATEIDGAAIVLTTASNAVLPAPAAVHGFPQTDVEEICQRLEKEIRESAANGEALQIPLTEDAECAIVPLSRRDQCFGVLVIRKKGPPIDAAEMHTYAGFAGQTAIGIHDCRFQANFTAVESSLDEVLSAL